ncbi:MAG TPA: DUF2267 domain-containing protein [Mycobacteriales bacterium]|nr:DUF2267 domain-containing protein [Mycobacteriales bacterium]
MLRYKEFVDSVRERLQTQEVERAREAIARTMYGLILWLPTEERKALHDALPGPLRPADWEDAAQLGGDARRFVRFVAAREGRSQEQVGYEAQAVLSALADEDPELARRLRAVLPGDFAELFGAPGGGPPTDLGAGSGVPPAELTDEDVRELLARLPEWTGDRHRLTRLVSPPDYVAEQLFQRIDEVERRLSHRAVVTRELDGSYRIEVWTHSEGLVTHLDAAFAEAIEDALEDVLEMRPARVEPPPPETEVAPRRPPAEPVPGTTHRLKREAKEREEEERERARRFGR